MKDIRGLYTEAFRDEGFGSLDAESRLLYLGLHLLADQDGVIRYSEKRIRAELFPYEGPYFDVYGPLKSLVDNGFIRAAETPCGRLRVSVFCGGDEGRVISSPPPDPERHRWLPDAGSCKRRKPPSPPAGETPPEPAHCVPEVTREPSRDGAPCLAEQAAPADHLMGTGGIMAGPRPPASCSCVMRQEPETLPEGGDDDPGDDPDDDPGGGCREPAPEGPEAGSWADGPPVVKDAYEGDAVYDGLLREDESLTLEEKAALAPILKAEWRGGVGEEEMKALESRYDEISERKRGVVKRMKARMREIDEERKAAAAPPEPSPVPAPAPGPPPPAATAALQAGPEAEAAFPGEDACPEEVADDPFPPFPPDDGPGMPDHDEMEAILKEEAAWDMGDIEERREARVAELEAPMLKLERKYFEDSDWEEAGCGKPVETRMNEAREAYLEAKEAGASGQELESLKALHGSLSEEFDKGRELYIELSNERDFTLTDLWEPGMEKDLGLDDKLGPEEVAGRMRGLPAGEVPGGDRGGDDPGEPGPGACDDAPNDEPPEETGAAVAAEVIPAGSPVPAEAEPDLWTPYERATPERVLDAYRLALVPALPNPRKLAIPTAANIKARIKEDPDRKVMSWWIDYFQSVSERSFLLGDNDSNWKADLHWLTGPKNMAKVESGAYMKERNPFGFSNRQMNNMRDIAERYERRAAARAHDGEEIA